MRHARLRRNLKMRNGALHISQRIKNNCPHPRDIPIGYATIIAAVLAATVVILGLWVSEKSYWEREAQALCENRRETARALQAEIGAIRFTAGKVHDALHKVVSGEAEVGRIDALFISPERSAWQAYSAKIGYLPVEQAERLSWFYGMHSVAINGLNDPNLPIQNKYSLSSALVMAADLAINVLKPITDETLAANARASKDEHAAECLNRRSLIHSELPASGSGHSH